MSRGVGDGGGKIPDVPGIVDSRKVEDPVALKFQVVLTIQEDANARVYWMRDCEK